MNRCWFQSEQQKKKKEEDYLIPTSQAIKLVEWQIGISHAKIDSANITLHLFTN